MPNIGKTSEITISDWLTIQKIDEIKSINVSARGTGLCLYLSKPFIELYAIRAGDALKIQFKQHYRKQAGVLKAEQTREAEPT